MTGLTYNDTLDRGVVRLPDGGKVLHEVRFLIVTSGFSPFIGGNSDMFGIQVNTNYSVP